MKTSFFPDYTQLADCLVLSCAAAVTVSFKPFFKMSTVSLIKGSKMEEGVLTLNPNPKCHRSHKFGSQLRQWLTAKL